MSISEKLYGNKIKRRHFIFEECDMIKVLNSINKHCKITRNMQVANCGWINRTMWFIHIDMTNKEWDTVKNDLNIVIAKENRDIPKKCSGTIYSIV